MRSSFSRELLMPEPVQFHSTRWTLIGRAAGSSGTGNRDALEELLKLYLPVLRTWLIRRHRMKNDQADDILQDFVVSRILPKELIRGASQQKGKFRSLLLTSLNRFVIDQHRRRNADKRTPDRADSLERDGGEPSVIPGTDSFDAAWARTVVCESLKRMWLHCQTGQQQNLWDVFCGRILVPLVYGHEPVSYDRIQEQCRFENPRQAANALITARRTFTRCLRSVVEEYAFDDSEIDVELNDLRGVLLGRGSISDDFLPDEIRASLVFLDSDLTPAGCPDHELTGFFNVEATRGSEWRRSDIQAMLNHYLTGPTAAVVKVPPECGEWTERPLAELFALDAPPLAMLKAVKNTGRSLIRHPEYGVPPDIGAWLYFIPIAIAGLRHQTPISRSTDDAIYKGLSWLLEQRWLDENTVETIRTYLGKHPSGRE